MQRFLTMLLLILAPGLLYAQDGEWTPLNDGLGDRHVYTIVAHPEDPDVLYAGTAAGLYRSDNRGEGWQQMCGGLPVRSVWVSQDGRTIMIARSGGSRSDGIWISRNGGDFEVLTWILWPSWIAVDPEDEDNIFCGSLEQGFMYTLDGGDDNWPEANDGLGDGAIYHLSVKNLEDETYLFASTEDGLFRCVVGDSIEWWEEAGPHNLPVMQTAFSFEEEEGVFAGTGDESDSDGLYYSDDLGDEWDVLRWAWYVQAVETMPELVVMASTEIGVQRSIDGGENWTEMNEELDDFDITDLMLQRVGDELLCYCTNDGDGILVYPIPLHDVPPSHFDLLEPEDSTVVDDLEVTFVWETSGDPDGEVTYIGWLRNREDSLFVAGLDTTELTVELDSLDIDFNEGNTVTWWILAVQDEDTVECNQRFSFFIRTMPRPPSPFGLLEPADDDTLDPPDEGRITFSWEESVDPDPDDTVSYTWWVRFEDDSVAFADLQDTELTVDLDTVFVAEREFTWWVLACSSPDTVECSERFRFFIRPEDQPPSHFSLLSPLDGDTLHTTLVTFRWEASEDPDPGDEVLYNWEMTFDECVETREGLDTTELILNLEEMEVWGDVSWSVRAVSGDLVTDCNAQFSFWYELVSVREDHNVSVADFCLHPAYPNPFNSRVAINFHLRQPAQVTLQVIDPLGRVFDELISYRWLETGEHSITWDAGDAAAGSYLVRLIAGGKILTRRIVLVR